MSLFLLSALAIGGCATSAAERAHSPGEAITLQPGGTAALSGGFELRYAGVVVDSRCPPGAQCIRAGEAQVRFELRTDAGAVQPLLLTTPGQPTGVQAGWRIELVELEFGAEPAATVRVQHAES